ncbi:sensor histidine kinase [Chryseobacterium taiwanense]|uniref:sensor histidine kinase n=1 Tax=Chryseobacterium taiwanense TaxID=363331 RepID=UPI0013F3F29C|nr:histidine kinase [Chryseobacterium taiwanense]
MEPEYISQKTFWWGGLVYSIVIVLLCAASAAFKLFQKWIKGHYVILELKNNLIQTELNLLKANISPHFLFNMLNNTEVLIRTEPAKAICILGELSDFLRYQLYDASRNMVLLSSEISFLRNFLNLEKVRRDCFNFEIVKIGIHTQVEIQPLIFMPFVENAVKHNANSDSKAFVDIVFEWSSEELVFTCRNPKENNSKLRNRQEGFGLPNVKQRLAILYPDRHNLTIEDEKDFYTVILKINL